MKKTDKITILKILTRTFLFTGLVFLLLSFLCEAIGKSAFIAAGTFLVFVGCIFMIIYDNLNDKQMKKMLRELYR